MHGENRQKNCRRGNPPSVFNQIDAVLFWNEYLQQPFQEILVSIAAGRSLAVIPECVL